MEKQKGNKGNKNNKKNPNIKINDSSNVDNKPNNEKKQNTTVGVKQKCAGFFMKIEGCVASCASKNKLICLALFTIASIMLSIVFLGITIAASQEAFSRKFPYAQCMLNQTANNFTKGDDSWIGL